MLSNTSTANSFSSSAMARFRIPKGLSGDRNHEMNSHETRFCFFNSTDIKNGKMDRWKEANNADGGEWIRFYFEDCAIFLHSGVPYSMAAKEMEPIVQRMRFIAMSHNILSTATPDDRTSAVNTSTQDDITSAVTTAARSIASGCVKAALRAQNSGSITDGPEESFSGSDDVKVGMAVESVGLINDDESNQSLIFASTRKTVCFDIERAMPRDLPPIVNVPLPDPKLNNNHALPRPEPDPTFFVNQVKDVLLYEKVQLDEKGLTIDNSVPEKIDQKLVGRMVSVSYARDGLGGVKFYAFDVGKIIKINKRVALIDFGPDGVCSSTLVRSQYRKGSRRAPTKAAEWRLLREKR